MKRAVPILLILWCTGTGWALSYLLVQIGLPVWVGGTIVGLSGITGFKIADWWCERYRIRRRAREIWIGLYGHEPPF